jgi:hypothetical protein
VIINTSPNSPFRVPSITTPSSHRRQNEAINVSSSPSLLSPSAFVRPRAPALKSGSRAQQIPAGVAQGFASAGSLWKSNHFDRPTAEDGVARESQADNDSKEDKRSKNSKEAHRRSIKKADGKLVRPKKKRKTEDIILTDTTSTEMRDDSSSAYFCPGSVNTANPDKTSAPDGVDAATTFSVSEYTFAVPVPESGAGEPEKPSKPSKPRKRTSKAKKDPNEAGNKHPRKRKAKSASFILNSDEPEINEPEAQPTSAQYSESMCRSNAKGNTLKVLNLANVTDAEAQGQEQSTLAVEQPTPGVQIHRGETPLKSMHFSSGSHSATISYDKPIERTQTAELDQQRPPAQDDRSVSNYAASRRRLSWTPVKAHIPEPLEESAQTSLVSQQAPPRQLSDLLGGFGYVSANSEHEAKPKHTIPDTALVTKKRRIELTDPSTSAPLARKQPEPAAPQEPKPAKRVKQAKKAQTITALATAAFQVAKQPSVPQAQGTDVTQFVAASKEKECPAVEDDEKPEPAPTKVKKPRKPRKNMGENASKDANVGTALKAKVAKPKKTKAKRDEIDRTAKVDSPATASTSLLKQDFLFGTSSQLAVDEEPAFIREMQTAVRESEALRQPVLHDASSTQHISTQAVIAPKWKSCVRVPSAPHGTCFEQADRELWCESSRDFKGGIFRAYSKLRKTQDVDRRGKEEATANAPNDACQLGDGLQRDGISVPGWPANNDLTELLPAQQPAEARSISLMRCGDDSTEQKDARTLINSDDSVQVISPPSFSGVMNPIASKPLAPFSIAERRALSPLRSPLRQLDRNILVAAAVSRDKASSFNEVRTFATSTADDLQRSRSSPRQKSGKPSKKTASPTTSPAKRRGRPPKHSISPTAAAPKQAGRPRKNADGASLTKRRGRPPKQQASASQQLQPPGTPNAVKSASQPEWIDIDEIYDSDPPGTPSPPRRRSASVPPVAVPLELSPRASANIMEKAPSLITASLRSGDTQWLDQRQALFGTITTTIKTPAQQNSHGKLSWYQKILLYDPIVLEDLTTWLNAQGVTVSVRKFKPKTNKKGRKRKVDANTTHDADSAQDEEAEWEVVQEPLQAWMVQKWCQEKSVCCLWKGGLRGGVTTEY